jgi:hypothetical protein
MRMDLSQSKGEWKIRITCHSCAFNTGGKAKFMIANVLAATQQLCLGIHEDSLSYKLSSKRCSNTGRIF